MSPALAGGFLTTAPPGESLISLNIIKHSTFYLLKPLILGVYSFLITGPMYFILNLVLFSNFIAVVNDINLMFFNWLLLVNESILFVHFKYTSVCKFGN